jgi:hypothetical protein
VLRPGGRVALAVWDRPEVNPWMAVMGRVMTERELGPTFAPDGPGPFAMSAPGVVRELLETAGFDEIEVEPLDLVFEAPSVDVWWDHVLQTSATTAEIVRGLAPAEHYALRDAVDAGYAPYVRDDGSVRLPARALAAAATA